MYPTQAKVECEHVISSIFNTLKLEKGDWGPILNETSHLYTEKLLHQISLLKVKTDI